jgi:hypothetical protein
MVDREALRSIHNDDDDAIPCDETLLCWTKSLAKYDDFQSTLSHERLFVWLETSIVDRKSTSREILWQFASVSCVCAGLIL